MSRSSRHTVMAGGAVLGIAGVLAIRSGPVDSDHDGMNETWLNDDLGAYAAGSLLLVAGALLFIGGLASTDPQQDIAATPPVTPAVAPATAPAATFAPAASAAPGADPAEPPAAEPAPRTITVERRPAVPLPDLPTTQAAERLARQVRSASAHGHCEVAWTMWADLAKLDPVYARAVRDGPVMARCAE